MLSGQQIENLRSVFPALKKQVHGKPAAFFDGPAGTQVPQSVIDAISDYLKQHNANHGGVFATSSESDRVLDDCHRAAADFLGASDADCVCFGANMTTITFSLSRALSRTWKQGDEVVVTGLEHDANYTPWIMAAEDAGATVRTVNIHSDDCTLDLDDFRSKINERTRLIAVGCASNATGTVNPVAEICKWASAVGACTFLDAVHFAPHDLIDVDAIGCDFLACSAYKFFGPHVGMLYGKRQHLEQLHAYKLRPAPDSLPGKWMTGTQNHACIAGTMAAIDYIAEIGRSRSEEPNNRRANLCAAFQSIREYEQSLLVKLLDGLAKIPDIKVWGITDPNRLRDRLPTVSFTHSGRTSEEVACRLADEAIFVWHGNYYALPLTERIGVEPDGMVRVGIIHYNTMDEIERLLEAISSM